MIRLLLSLLLCVPALAHASYAARPEVQAFVEDLAKRHGFVKSELKRVFSRVQRVEPVLEAIARPAERVRSWEEYRALLVTERRITEGVEFWKKYPRTLERAEKNYGVPPEYVVAIIGVETFYGRNTGNWRVVDALTTLAFDYPPRAGFFRSELESYLLMAREAGLDVFSVRGSYAGAIGIPQFMPSSARRYAVDFDGNGRIDLQKSRTDAIGSVANFLKVHGWERDADVLVGARVTGDAWRAYVDTRFEPKHSMTELRQAGVEFDSPEPAGAAGALIELASAERPSDFRVGLRNFYVITRYNRSAFYAAAVADLARELKKAYDLGR
ncbi:MAG TPA: lytic murein transglycosylase B [Burkholderiales bacterium]|nr:lytic murein transglycosylase B [Burkholderiales bacterium]